MSGLLATFADPGRPLQEPFDVAVVMPTVLRPSIGAALRSVFAQDLRGRIHLLIGVDVMQGDPAAVETACRERPAHCAVQLFHPGYSTSVRHGGLCAARDGGVLRAVLSLLANAPLVAYLDDDNRWHPAHLRTLREAISGHDYAFSLRWFVHPDTGRVVCRDDWESLGPGRGIYAGRYGGFIDPNCLMLDRERCADILPLWTRPLAGDIRGMSADRTVFAALRRGRKGAATAQTTVYYRLDPGDAMHEERMKVMAAAYADAGRQEPTRKM